MRKTTFVLFSFCFAVSVGARDTAYDPTPWNEGSAQGAYLKSHPDQEAPKEAEESMTQEAKKPFLDPKPWHVGERHPYLAGENKGCCPKGDTVCMDEGREMCLSEDAPAKK